MILLFCYMKKNNNILNKININYNMKKIIIYVFLFFILLVTVCIFNFLNMYFSKRVQLYMDNKGVLYTQSFIKESIIDEVIEEIKIESLYFIKEDNNDQVESVLINTSQVNKILSLVNASLENSMSELSKNELIIPFTSVFGDTLFSSIGPNIKLRIIPIGNYKCDILSTAKEYGINNTLFEIYITIEMKIETIVPLQKSESKVNCKIPIVMQIIHGEVPRYYYNTDKLVPDVNDTNEQ